MVKIREGEVEIDELDEKILQAMLNGDGIGAKITGLSRVLKEPRSTVNLRVMVMENEEILTGYRPAIDWEKIGYKMTGYIGIICSEDVIKDLLAILRKEKSVYALWEVTTGTFDVLLKCRFKGYDEIAKLREKIRRLEGIQEVSIWLLGTAHKEE